MFSNAAQIIGPFHMETCVLNRDSNIEVGGGSIPASSECTADIVGNLRSSIMNLKASFMSDSGDSVDYEGMRNSKQFSDYKLKTKLLSQLQLEGMETAERMALFINIYNCLVIHGIIMSLHCSIFGAFVGRLILYSTASYQIGEFVYSLNDIEHGLLRCNRTSPVPLSSRQFADTDPRLRFAAPQLDPRIHFALNCGAKGCPPIAVYKASTINKQLDMATKSFVRGNTVIKKYGTGDDSSFNVSLSMLFKWYRGDFGVSDTDILHWLIPFVSVSDTLGDCDTSSDSYSDGAYLKELLEISTGDRTSPDVQQKDRFNISYDEYDWAMNSK